ncbi:MAG: DUF2914 domain-containing protein [Deltaproteobacteria bacterium]|jgi:hypothetical protein|nr:DUF2914 domain-containing protein [Deltaproteobacteria bacterium]
MTATDPPAEAGAVRAATARIRDFHDRYAPWISLALGVLARAMSRKDVDFAPKAVAIVALAWLFPVAVARWLHEPRPGAREGRLRHLLRTASPTVTVLLYKNVLFFLVPVWFGSAHVLSQNVVVPLLLAAMALFTCFSRQYRELVLERPRRRVLWTAAVLFAALVPATAVLAFTSPRTSIVVSALLASAVAWAALAPNESILSKRGVSSALAVALPVAAVLGLAAPIFPPVPMVCYARGAGTGIAKRELEGRADAFPAGTARVYAWFAITLPKRHRQAVVFQWFHEGRRQGSGLRTTVEGGRKAGFRTWTVRHNPAPGRYRVDMLTGRSSQLIGRTEFEVLAR